MLASANAAHAVDLYCFEAPDTLKNICYVPGQVSANGDLRASPLFMGGPKSVDRTTLTIVVNCKSSVMTLQDRQGTNVQGGSAGDTRMAAELSKAMCAVKKTRADKALRQ